MPEGPGKYDSLCTYVRAAAQAQAVVVIVVNGSRGNGFSVQTEAGVSLKLADMLELVAAEIRKANNDNHGGGKPN